MVEYAWVEAPPGATVTGPEVWDIDDDETWFLDVVRSVQAREKAYVEAVKFNESDWQRNSGRFARYVGSPGGGRAGGAAAAADEGEGVEDAVGPVTALQQRNAEKWLAERGITREGMLAQARSQLANKQAAAEGKVWYDEAHGEAQRLGREYGVSTDAASGVLAAMSPRMEWPQNKLMAENVLKTTSAKRFNLQPQEVEARYQNGLRMVERGEVSRDKVEAEHAFFKQYVGSRSTSSIPARDLARLVGGQGTYDNKEKAIRIARGERPRDVLAGERTGMKVRSFYDNITRPSVSQEVTIDTRMISSLVGGGKFQNDKEQATVFSNPARYAVLRDVVRTAAAEQGEPLPHKTQATIWVAQGSGR